jgi:hypothetical protein
MQLHSRYLKAIGYQNIYHDLVDFYEITFDQTKNYNINSKNHVDVN